MKTIKTALTAGIMLLAASAFTHVQAQGFPNRPIRLIVPFAPGGGNDIVARLVGQKLQERLGQPVVVENKAGAGGNIGSEMVARAAPDGYTLLLATNTLTINPGIYKKLPFDVVKDFAPVALVAKTPIIVVTNLSVPIRSIADLVSYAKSHPAGLNYSSPGIGTPHHLATELFSANTGIQMVHVPYKGAAQALTAVVAGETQLMFAASSSATPFIQTRKLNAIGTSTAQRFSALPTVPTIQEQGIAGYDVSIWYGVLAPAKTPQDIINRLSSELNAIVQLPDMKEKFSTNAMEPAQSSPAQMQSLIAADLDRWAIAVKTAKIIPE
jgi:tripartite-type tricarboxylate transporter receptor subunit TctC